MLISIKEKDPNGTGVKLFRGEELEISSNFTVLVGCNGSGKSTLLRLIEHHCKENGIAYLKFNNTADGGDNSVSESLFSGDFSFVATHVSSSEGERISLDVSKFFGMLGHKVRNSGHLENGIVLLLDASDSGVSIDSVREFKESLKNLIIPDIISHGLDVKIIVSANEFEMVEGEDCIDATTLKHKSFKTYNSYRNFILRSRKFKDERYQKEEKIQLRSRRR